MKDFLLCREAVFSISILPVALVKMGRESSTGTTRTHLISQLLADVGAAAVTALAVSPTVCLIDSAIIIKSSTQCTLRACFAKILRPASAIPRELLFSPAARLVLLVYFGTYTTANTLDTMTKATEAKHASAIKFASTSTVATALTIYKDSRLVRMLGRGSLKSAVPASSYALFTLRDAITIGGSFTLPPLLAPKLSGMMDSEARRLNTAQFAIPAAIQLITTPVHLLGIDLYNRRAKVGWADRAAVVGRDMASSVAARIVRIIPAFSVGGILNMSMRSQLSRTLGGMSEWPGQARLQQVE